MTPEGIEAYRTALVPRALLVTPNIWEAALLAGLDPEDGASVGDLAGMVEAARRIYALGPAWVLVKGGHLPGVEVPGHPDAPEMVPDVLFDGTEVIVVAGPLVATANTHGTGCSLSSAITAGLALGGSVPDTVESAKAFVHDALVGAASWTLGRGHGPLDHFDWSARSAESAR
jgi:hydroxymethylpyrimidine/phosphomethylpyrimidine kinase